jgi:hypothetical protein
MTARRLVVILREAITDESKLVGEFYRGRVSAYRFIISLLVGLKS